MSVLRNKVRYQMRRGLLELDMIMTNFVKSGFDSLTEDELKVMEEMLTWDDPKLMQSIDGNLECAEPYASIVAKIREAQPFFKPGAFSDSKD